VKVIGADWNGMAREFDVRVDEKLDRILRLLGMIAVKGLSQTEQIAILSRVGFLPKDIADVLGTTANTVRVALVGIRRAAKHGRRRITLPREEPQNE
jgi:DNA-binding CsgD family transcriptional regulator